MLMRTCRYPSNLRALANLRSFCDQKKINESERSSLVGENPLRRTLNVLGNDMRRVKNFFTPAKKQEESGNLEDAIKDFEIEELVHNHCDVLVIGGGGIGSSVAYWLKKRAREGLNVVVVEKDSTYQSCSTALSVGGLRQQFSLQENIEMSLYGADFLRDSKEMLGDDVKLNFTPHGYLMLSTEASAEQLQKNSMLQNSLGAKNELLTPQQLRNKFPWLNTEDLKLGCHGLEKEGWFDPWSLLCGLKQKAIGFGAHFVEGEVIDFEFRSQPDILMEGIEHGSYTGVDHVIVRRSDGKLQKIKFALVVIAAGAQSGKIAKMARIGNGSGILDIPLPVEPRKRFVYVFNCQDDAGPGMNTPLTIDPNGTYFRRDGLSGNYLGGRSPSPDNEPSVDNLDVDHTFFDTHIWPHLAKRVPAFEAIKVNNSWAGFYEYNTFDENGIIGAHPYYHNMFIATGFSGHGIQQAPAVGRAVAELIIDGGYRTIDLRRLGFDRLVVQQPMFETNIV